MTGNLLEVMVDLDQVVGFLSVNYKFIITQVTEARKDPRNEDHVTFVE